MAGIPNTLLSSLKDVLDGCDDVFFSHQALSSVFIDERLALWRSRLPEASDLGQRIDYTIKYLYEKNSVDGNNALTLFLRVLKERYDDDRKDRLQALVEQLAYSHPSTDYKEARYLEANPLSAPMLPTRDAEIMLTCARSVARVVVQGASKSKSKIQKRAGTGWLIAPTLLLTCWHVVEARSVYETPPNPADLRKQLANTLVTFDYKAVGKGVQYSVDDLLCPTLEDHPFDYALLRLCDRRDFPLSHFRYLHLDKNLPLNEQTELYIIQHPLAQYQHSAGDSFQGFSSLKGRILYKTPTENGTSGAPVFNRATWRVVALHNGESKDGRYREGTLLSYIMEDIKRLRPNLYKEVISAQRILKE